MSNQNECSCFRKYGSGVGIGICQNCGLYTCDKFYGCYNPSHEDHKKNDAVIFYNAFYNESEKQLIFVNEKNIIVGTNS